MQHNLLPIEKIILLQPKPGKTWLKSNEKEKKCKVIEDSLNETYKSKIIFRRERYMYTEAAHLLGSSKPLTNQS